MNRKLWLSLPIIIVAAILLSSCGGDKSKGPQVFSYSIADQSGVQAYKVQIAVTESYYQLGESGDVQLTVVYSAENLGEAPLRFSWEDKYVQDFAKNFYEPQDGRESRELNSGQTQGELTVTYGLPANVADGGGMNKLWWGLFDSDRRDFTYRIKLHPQIRH